MTYTMIHQNTAHRMSVEWHNLLVVRSPLRKQAITTTGSVGLALTPTPAAPIIATRSCHDPRGMYARKSLPPIYLLNHAILARIELQAVTPEIASEMRKKQENPLTRNSIAQKEGHNFSNLALFAGVSLCLLVIVETLPAFPAKHS